MENKNSFKSFLKWYLKYFLIFIIVGLILVGLVYILFLFFTHIHISNKKYTPDIYFSKNKNKLYEIVYFIEENSLTGFLYYDKEGDIRLNGSIGDCLFNGCDIIKNSNKMSFELKKISNGIGYNQEDFLVLSMKDHIYMGKDVWKPKEASFVYKKGYFKDKKVGYNRKYPGDESGIIYIFNNDWGIITWCYLCYGGGWD